MSEREKLRDELREIEGSYTHEITKEKQRRARQIINLLNQCQCRNCGTSYDRSKSRAEYKGFCSAKCQHEKARKLGYRKGKDRTEFQVLKGNECIGDDPVIT